MVKLRTLHRNLKLLMRVKEGRILLFAFPRRFGGKILQNLPLHYQILSSASVMVPPLAVVCIGTKTVRRLQKSFISAVSVVFKLYRFGNSPISLEKISLPDPDDEDRVYTVLLCSFKHSKSLLSVVLLL